MRNDMERGERIRKARVVFMQALLLNLLVAAGKLVCGFLTASLSMVADGFHAVIDASSNVISILGLSVAAKPPDENHPYGHRKFESLAAIGISFLMFLASFEVVSEAFHRLTAHEAGATQVSVFSYLVMIISAAINYGISRYEHVQGKKLNNALLAADSKHSMSDIWVSLTVIGTLVAVQLKMPIIDLVGSFLIVLIILYAGYEIIREHLGSLTDVAVFDTALVEKLVMEVPGVSNCHKIRSRGYNDHVFLDLHVQVPRHLSIEDAHQICFNVEEKLRENLGDSLDVLVHVEDDAPPAHQHVAEVLVPPSKTNIE